MMKWEAILFNNRRCWLKKYDVTQPHPAYNYWRDRSVLFLCGNQKNWWDKSALKTNTVIRNIGTRNTSWRLECSSSPPPPSSHQVLLNSFSAYSLSKSRIRENPSENIFSSLCIITQHTLFGKKNDPHQSSTYFPHYQSNYDATCSVYILPSL